MKSKLNEINTLNQTFKDFYWFVREGATITGINIVNPRVNGVYRIYITTTGAGATLNKTLTTNNGTMITSYTGNQALVSNYVYILKIEYILNPFSITYNCVSLTQFFP